MALKALLKSIPILRRLSYQWLFWSRENNLHNFGKGNRVKADAARLERCTIRIKGSNNQLVFEPGCSVQDCEIEVIGDNHILHIGENVVLTQSLLWFEDHHCQIKIGAGTTMQRFGHIAVTEPYRKIEVGKNCMFSFSVDIRNGDSHTIFDTETGKRVNWAKNIRIADHVWLGAHTQVLGGAEIGENSIIGIRAMVNGKIGSNSIAVGSPARAIKSGYNWDSRRWYDGDPLGDLPIF